LGWTRTTHRYKSLADPLDALRMRLKELAGVHIGYGYRASLLCWALNISLEEILNEGMDARFNRHRRLAASFMAGIEALGLRQLPVSKEIEANTLSAIYYPGGVDSSLVKRIGNTAIIVAESLLPGVKDKYFRVGHMGAVTASDILSTLGAIEQALKQSGYSLGAGSGTKAAHEYLLRA